MVFSSPIFSLFVLTLLKKPILETTRTFKNNCIKGKLESDYTYTEREIHKRKDLKFILQTVPWT